MGRLVSHKLGVGCLSIIDLVVMNPPVYAEKTTLMARSTIIAVANMEPSAAYQILRNEAKKPFILNNDTTEMVDSGTANNACGVQSEVGGGA